MVYMKISPDKKLIRQYLIDVLILSAVYIICSFSILRANFDYIDDSKRILIGYMGWDEFGRYLANIFASILNTSRYLTDISPLSQIIALVILSFTGIAIIYKFFSKHRVTILGFISLIPFALNPYFLECLSYKFDAPLMALSIAVSVLPIVLFDKNTALYFIASFIGTLSMCMSYQASSGIYPMLVVLVAFSMWCNGNNASDIFKYILTSALAYVSALLIFKLFIMKSFEQYVSTSLPGIESLVPNTVENLKKYYSYVFSDFTRLQLICFILIFISFVYVSAKNSCRHLFITVLLSIFVLFIMAALCFGVYPLFTEPLFEPRAMYGFGIYVAILCIYVCHNWYSVKILDTNFE